MFTEEETTLQAQITRLPVRDSSTSLLYLRPTLSDVFVGIQNGRSAHIQLGQTTARKRGYREHGIIKIPK